MVRLVFLLSLFSATVLGFSACESTPAPKAKGHASIPVAADQAHAEAQIKFLDEVRIELPPLTNPEHRWTVVLNDTRFLQPVGEIAAATDGSGKFVATFLAIRAGRRSVRFFALPPTGRELTPSQSYEVRVEIE